MSGLVLEKTVSSLRPKFAGYEEKSEDNRESQYEKCRTRSPERPSSWAAYHVQSKVSRHSVALSLNILHHVPTWFTAAQDRHSMTFNE